MDNNNVVQTQHLIGETYSPGKTADTPAIFRSYATVFRDVSNGRTLALQFSTTFSLAKNPDDHRVTHTVNFNQHGDALNLLHFLSENL